jgi:HEAT repeat protein
VTVRCRLSVRLLTAVLWLLVGVGLTGCPWWRGPGSPLNAEIPLPPETPEKPEGSKAPPSKPIAKTPLFKPGTGTADSNPADGLTLLGRDGWVRAIAPAGPPAATEAFRWRYPELEDLLADPAAEPPDLRAALSDAHPTVAANAAIALARRGDGSGMDQLTAAIRNRQLKLSVRSAAAEALGRLGEPSPLGPLRELIDQYGRFGPTSHARYLPEIHAELIRGLARHVDPADESRFTHALRSPSPEVQLEALAAWGAGQAAELPIEAADLRTAQDSRVRAAALRTLARRRHPQAEEWVAAGLSDCDVAVRLAAIAGLGELGGDRSRGLLKERLHDRAELIRAEAVAALARAGDRSNVIEASDDKSWRVRMAVTEALARYPDPAGIALARKLLDDPASSVGPQVLESIRSWPLDKAGPILLEAMDRPAYAIRKKAAEQLAARWPPAAEFAHDAPADRRQEILQRLTSEFHRQTGLVEQGTVAATEGPTPGRPARSVSPQRVAEVQQMVRRLSDPATTWPSREEATRALGALGGELIPALEQIVLEQKQPLPEVIYREVLPKSGPVFTAMDRLTSEDVAMRRRAAAELAARVPRAPLGRLATERLASLVTAEQDVLVWRSALDAVADDGTEPATRLAIAGISHPSAEVRRRACEHLAAHPDPAHARLLLPALADSSDNVAEAAVKAIGAGGRLEDTRPLEQLLGHNNQALRFQAAVVLTRLGHPSGPAALQRLAYSGDPIVRREVAIAMGELGDPVFSATLIRMLDDGHGIRRAALESLPKVVGRNVAEAAVGSSPSITEQVDQWKRWFERQRQTIGNRPENVNPLR